MWKLPFYSLLTILISSFVLAAIDVGYNDAEAVKVIMGQTTSSNYGVLDGTNVWLGLNTFNALTFFSGGINLGTTLDATAGNLRFTSNQFQGYNGTDWVALSGAGGADTTCNDVVCSLGDDTGYRFAYLDFTSTTGMSDLVDNDTWPGVAVNYYTSSEVDGLLNDKLDITDQRYNETPALLQINASKLNVTDQRYNETPIIATINNLSNSSIASLMGNTTLARIGDCPNGQVVQNTTTGGVQCVVVSSSANWSISIGLLRGFTPLQYNGNLSNTTHTGYVRGDMICNTQYSGSHFCMEVEILKTNEVLPLADFNGTYWMKKGAPGYTAEANDCSGFTTTSTTSLGAFWNYDNPGVGQGKLTNCAQTKNLTCCGGA